MAVSTHQLMSVNKRSADESISEEPAAKRQVRFSEPADPEADVSDDDDGAVFPFGPPPPPEVELVLAASTLTGDEAEPATEEIDNIEKHTAWHTCAALLDSCKCSAAGTPCNAELHRTLVLQADDEPLDSRAAEPLRSVQAVVAEQA